MAECGAEPPPHANAGSVKERQNVRDAREWWQCFFEDWGERDPVEDKIHVPVCLTWTDIHEQYVQDMLRRGKRPEDLCSIQVFGRIRKRCFSNVRLCRKTWMPRCGVCIQLSQNRLRCRSEEERKAWMLQKREHLELELSERHAYHSRQTLARGQPSEYMSVIIDSATALRLIRQFPYPKGGSWPGKTMKVYPEGIINHSHGGTCISFHLGQHSRNSNLITTLLYLHLRDKLRDDRGVRSRWAFLSFAFAVLH
jgi:hypothetical protein